MKSNQVPADVATVFADVLADLAYMFSGPDDLLLRRPADHWIETSIAYRGPANGGLRLRCTSKFAAKLASNMLGVETIDSDVQHKAEDALKELLSVLCGHVVSALHGTNAVFDFSPPEIKPLSTTPDWREDRNTADATFHVDGQIVQLFHTRSLPSTIRMFA